MATVLEFPDQELSFRYKVDVGEGRGGADNEKCPPHTLSQWGFVYFIKVHVDETEKSKFNKQKNCNSS